MATKPQYKIERSQLSFNCYWHRCEGFWEKLVKRKICKSNKQKLLVAELDKTFILWRVLFKYMTKKSGRKLCVLAILSNYMSFKQRRILMKAFTEAQFDHCPLVWMFYGRVLNRKTSHLRKGLLQIVCRNSRSSFDGLLQK